MKSIKKKLVLITLVLILVPFVFSNLMNYYFISSGFESRVKKENLTLAHSISNNVEEFMDKAYKISERLTDNSNIKGFDSEKQEKVLNKTIDKNSYFKVFYVQDTTGMQTATSIGAVNDMSGRWWFKRIMKTKDSFISKSYFTITDNIPVTSIIMPIYNQGKLKGVFGADLKLNYLQKLVEKLSLGKGSHAYIIDGQGVVIAHPNKKQVSQLYNYREMTKKVILRDENGNIVRDAEGNQKSELRKIEVPDKLKKITSKVLNGKSGVAEYVNNKGEEVISGYYPIELKGDSNNWAVITVQNKDKAMGFVSSVQYKNIIIAAGLILLVIAAMYYAANKITTPILNIVDLMEQAAGGDLSVYSAYQGEDEIGRLSDSFNDMINDLRDIIQTTEKTAARTLSTSEKLSASSQETAAAVEEATALTEEFTSSVDQLSANAQDMAQSANEISNLAQSGLEDMEDTQQKMEDILQSSSESQQAIEELNAYSLKIENIIDVISDISDQTNLLALNAAIEAARAGEAGHGFAVVAEEIRELAEETQKSVENIKNIIEELTSQTDQTVNTIQKSSDQIEAGAEMVNETEEAFQNIANKIQSITVQIQTVAETGQDLASGSNEISKTSEEQAEATQEMSNLAQQLSQMAAELKELVDRFEIK
ncbi:methyl-accepting chemotaxis protein [Sporohalobacter salinus]|uniref:methyl-accepting chemotaxis protein n=1 Tax=Sporohalobacter salinus TaxID=1494606 RepID=UPI00195F7C51|nr:methyl-accepting chemotaxis protein [Sporohalobacter salinus]MBM7623248.1 methyl-accepting chemotaxis protein [Sporohalobacter salinus]